MTAVTSINNYSKFTVKQRNKIAGSNSSQGGALWGVFLSKQSPHRSRRLWLYLALHMLHMITIYLQNCKQCVAGIKVNQGKLLQISRIVQSMFVKVFYANN